MKDKLEQFEQDLSNNIADQMRQLGDRVNELDWYADNLFPEEEQS